MKNLLRWLCIQKVKKMLDKMIFLGLKTHGEETLICMLLQNVELMFLGFLLIIVVSLLEEHSSKNLNLKS